MPGNAATNQKAKQKPRAASQRDVATKLRRIALAQQGLNKPAAFGRGIGGARRALEQIGYVQIDTISVVERAHHHVFFSGTDDAGMLHLSVGALGGSTRAFVDGPGRQPFSFVLLRVNTEPPPAVKRSMDATERKVAFRKALLGTA